MKAWMVDDDTQAMSLVEMPSPEPREGQVRIDVRASSLNRGEFLKGGTRAKGATSGRLKPVGMEAAGVVSAVGPGVSGWRLGDRVMGRAAGGLAEQTILEALDAIPVPATMDWADAGATAITGMVAYDMLVAEGGLKSGDTLLVTGISSGVGVSCLQIAQALGARVVGTSGSATKLERLRALGLDAGVLTRGADFVDAVRQFTEGKGVQLAVNNVGGTVFEACLRSLAYMGRLALVGYVDGVKRSEIDLDWVHSQRLRIFGVSNRHRTAAQRAATVSGFTRDVLPMLVEGRFRPLIDARFPFGQLPQAREHMLADQHIGKIVVMGSAD